MSNVNQNLYCISLKCIDKSNWIPDEMAMSCMLCRKEFTIIFRRHHCRLCGIVICGGCSDHKLPSLNNRMLRTCNKCFSNVIKSTIRLENHPDQYGKNSISSLPIVQSYNSTTGSGGGGVRSPPSIAAINSQMKGGEAQKTQWKRSLKTTEKQTRHMSNIKRLFGMKWNRGKVLTEDDIYQIIKEDIKDFEVAYNRLRDAAQEQLRLRDECYKRSFEIQSKCKESDEAIPDDTRALCKDLMEQGKSHHNLMNESNWKAARMMFSLRNPQLIIEDEESDDDDDEEEEEEQPQEDSSTNPTPTSEGEETAKDTPQKDQNALIIDLYGLLSSEIQILFKEKINSLALESESDNQCVKRKLNIINLGEGIPNIVFSGNGGGSSFLFKEDTSKESIGRSFLNHLSSESTLVSALSNIQYTNYNNISMDLALNKSQTTS